MSHEKFRINSFVTMMIICVTSCLPCSEMCYSDIIIQSFFLKKKLRSHKNSASSTRSSVFISALSCDFSMHRELVSMIVFIQNVSDFCTEDGDKVVYVFHNANSCPIYSNNFEHIFLELFIKYFGRKLIEMKKL